MNLTMPWTNTKTDQLTRTLDAVRRALSDEADHIAKVAAEIGRETNQQATKISHEAEEKATTAAAGLGGSAASLAQQFLRRASKFGDQIAASGRKSMSDLGHDVQSLGDELKHVRVTTEPRRSGPDLMPGIALLGGFGAGIALMYFFDPEQGNRRRALLRDQVNKWTRIGRETAEGKAKDFRNRTIGVMHEARKAAEGATETAEAETSEYVATSGSSWGEELERKSEQETPASIG